MRPAIDRRAIHNHPPPRTRAKATRTRTVPRGVSRRISSSRIGKGGRPRSRGSAPPQLSDMPETEQRRRATEVKPGSRLRRSAYVLLRSVSSSDAKAGMRSECLCGSIAARRGVFLGGLGKLLLLLRFPGLRGVQRNRSILAPRLKLLVGTRGRRQARRGVIRIWRAALASIYSRATSRMK